MSAEARREDPVLAALRAAPKGLPISEEQQRLYARGIAEAKAGLHVDVVEELRKGGLDDSST